MASVDAGESVPGQLLRTAIWLVVTAGVFWCCWTSWQEGTPTAEVVGRHGEREVFVLLATPDPRLMHWLPAATGIGALIAGLIRSGTGRRSLPFLMLAAMMTGMKAVTVGIEWLLSR